MHAQTHTHTQTQTHTHTHAHTHDHSSNNYTPYLGSLYHTFCLLLASRLVQNRPPAHWSVMGSMADRCPSLCHSPWMMMEWTCLQCQVQPALLVQGWCQLNSRPCAVKCHSRCTHLKRKQRSQNNLKQGDWLKWTWDLEARKTQYEI